MSKNPKQEPQKIKIYIQEGKSKEVKKKAKKTKL